MVIISSEHPDSLEAKIIFEIIGSYKNYDIETIDNYLG